MASILSPEDKIYFEKILSKAEPYDKDDPVLRRLDGDQNVDRMISTLAKLVLEGQLR